ncbi:unnamed protein product, partial [Mesorhabditis spiculigera]
MSEVSALFAKRKDKQKKPKVVSIDAVAEVLVRHANKTEFEAFAEVEDSRPSVDAPPLRPGVDTEWIDEFEDDCGRLEGLGIKDMGAEISEKEEVSEHAQENVVEVQHKGWFDKKEDGQTDDESSAPIVAKPATGGAYRLRVNRANIDLTNQEMFPTIGAAVEMEKRHKDDKKNPWTSVEQPPASGGRYVPPCRRADDDADFAASRRAAKEDAIAAARAMTRTPTASAPRPCPAGDLKPSAPPAQVDAKPEETKPAARTKPKYQCSNAICRHQPYQLAQHTVAHLAFRPWKCSVCEYTTTRKGDLQVHLNAQHQGTGRAVDNRTAEYFDALEAKINANFPAHSSAIAKYIREQKKALEFRDASDHADDNRQECRKLSSCMECRTPMRSTSAPYLVRHSLSHLSFRPWKCSVCACTRSEKDKLQTHLNAQHHGNGWAIDNRTAEFYDELEAETKTDFPAHSSAIAKYIRGRKKAAGFQDASDNASRHDMTPVTPGKGLAVKRRWPTDDNPTDSEEEEYRQTTPVCMQCSTAISCADPCQVARHSVAHLTFRPWKCSVCPYTTTRKGNLQKHLKERHHGNGRVLDNRTAEYYDALEAKTKANFPAHSSAIAKYIGCHKEALGFEDSKDHEEDQPQDGRKISVCKECKNSIGSTNALHLIRHSLTHLTFRPWKCSVCTFTAKPKSVVKTHLNVQRQGNGRVIDNRTAQYYDALKEKAQANFPGRAKVIAKPDRITRMPPLQKTTHKLFISQPLATKVSTFRETLQTRPEAASSNAGTTAEVAVLTIPSESPPFHANSAFSPPSRVAVVQPRIETVPQIDTDHSIDKRFDETIMTTKLGGAKISSDMARTRAAMRETKSDVARMQINMALLETLSETRNAENRRLKQQNDQQCSQAISRNEPSHLALHSSMHLAIRPWQCSVCTVTAKLKSHAKTHLKTQHQGNGRVIDNRTADYYDELEAQTKANFPAHSRAIAKYIGSHKEALGFQDASDNEDDNPQDGRKISICTECSHSIRTSARALSEHSSTHLAIRPWKCSVCACTMSEKGNLQKHLNELHQGNGWAIDNRTAEYYDALEAKTKANFPAQSSAIAKSIGGQKKTLGFQDGSDHEDDYAQTRRKIFSCKECRRSIVSTRTWYLAEHSVAHLSFRPWQCSVCTFTAKLKSVVKHHLKTQHQGNGRIIDSRTAEYYDALEAKTKANFPGHSSAIAKSIGRRKEALGCQDASDHEDDNPLDDRKISLCKECRHSIVLTHTGHLAQHSSTHLTFRPWKCSVCACTTTQKGSLQRHLNEQHQGNGRVIDNRTAEYYDALKAKAQANFPSRAKAIAKHIGGQRHVSGIQGGVDNEDDTPEDNPPIVRRPAPGNKSSVPQGVVPDAVPPRSKEKSTHRTMADTQSEVKQELLDVENSSFDFHVVIEGSEADALADAHAPIRHQNEQNVRIGDKDQSSSPTLHPIVVKEELLDENPAEEPRRIDKKKKKKIKRGEEDWAAEETLSEKRNAENRRLKQQNHQQAAMVKLLQEEMTAMKERIRNG